MQVGSRTRGMCIGPATHDAQRGPERFGARGIGVSQPACSGGRRRSLQGAPHRRREQFHVAAFAVFHISAEILPAEGQVIEQQGKYLGESCGDLKAGEAMGTDGTRVMVQ